MSKVDSATILLDKIEPPSSEEVARVRELVLRQPDGEMFARMLGVSDEDES